MLYICEIEVHAGGEGCGMSEMNLECLQTVVHIVPYLILPRTECWDVLGCYFFSKRTVREVKCMCAKSLQLCLTLCNSMDCSPPGREISLFCTMCSPGEEQQRRLRRGYPTCPAQGVLGTYTSPGDWPTIPSPSPAVLRFHHPKGKTREMLSAI